MGNVAIVLGQLIAEWFGLGSSAKNELQESEATIIRLNEENRQFLAEILRLRKKVSELEAKLPHV